MFLLGLAFGALMIGLWVRATYEKKLQRLCQDQDEHKDHMQVAQNNLTHENMRLTSELNAQSQYQQSKKDLVVELEQKFEHLSQKVFSSQVSSFQSHTQESLGHILNPLKEKIQSFESKVDHQFEKSVRDITTLKTHIEHMSQANLEISKAAEHLTSALKGDVRVQGHWGEMVLTKILDVSGLREGIEYTTQGRDLKLKSNDGRTAKPDVIVHLPDDQHIVVDAKVSLKHYEAIGALEDTEGIAALQKLFLTSVRSHIQNLGSKKYHALQGLKSPELTLLFMPIEGAFSMALQMDSRLYAEAWDQGIVLVSPTTLLATLRTVASLWKTQRQNQNALEIARQAGGLYDKFVGFLNDLQDIGKHVNRTQASYDQAIQKIAQGRGNLLSRVEHLKTMGAKTEKKIPLQNNEDMTIKNTLEGTSENFLPHPQTKPIPKLER